MIKYKQTRIYGNLDLANKISTIGVSKVAKELGVTRSYVSKLINGKEVLTEHKYHELVNNLIDVK